MGGPAALARSTGENVDAQRSSDVPRMEVGRKSGNEYDAIIIGAGNAGLAAAGVLRAAGELVTIIEKRDVGGTCPIRGCVPKKVLAAAAQTLDLISRASEHRIQVSRPELDWTALVDREQSFVSDVSHDIEAGLTRRGIMLTHGAARFTGPETVEVAGETLKGKHIIIATGSRPKQLPIEGFQYAITSDKLLSERSL